MKEELAERDTELGIIEDEKDAACARADAAECMVAEGAESVVQMKIAAALLEGRIAGLQEALRAQVTEMSAQGDLSAASSQLLNTLPSRASDDGKKMESGLKPESADLAEHAQVENGEEGAIEKAPADKLTRRTRKAEYPETDDLPGISSPEASRDLGPAA